MAERDFAIFEFKTPFNIEYSEGYSVLLQQLAPA